MGFREHGIIYLNIKMLRLGSNEEVRLLSCAGEYEAQTISEILAFEPALGRLALSSRRAAVSARPVRVLCVTAREALNGEAYFV